jgi:hypothetical protein
MSETAHHAYARALRAKLEHLGLSCRDERQTIDGRTEPGFVGSKTVDGQPVTVRFALSETRDHVTSMASDYWSALLFETPLELNLGIRVQPKGFLRSTGHVRVDHEAFDAELDLTGDEPGRTKALFGDDVCKALHDLCSLGGEVHVSDSKIEVHQTEGFLGIEPTLQRMAVAAQRLKDAALRVPPPAELEPALATWRAHAEAHELSFTKDPFRLSGKGIAAQAMRLSRTAYETQVSVAFLEPLAAGLALRPAGTLEHFVEMVAGRDMQLDDAPFDRAFTIHAEKEDIVRVALGENVRAQLLALGGRGIVSANDHGITLLTKRHVEVPADIEAMREIARGVQENLRPGAGPYR